MLNAKAKEAYLTFSTTETEGLGVEDQRFLQRSDAGGLNFFFINFLHLGSCSRD